MSSRENGLVRYVPFDMIWAAPKKQDLLFVAEIVRLSR
jgi:hypothetical protein